MFKIKSKQANKQTNKQKTNNHFLDPEYLSQINSDPHEIFRVYSCGPPKMIKIKKKNKPVNKQTNKQTNKQLFFRS